MVIWVSWRVGFLRLYEDSHLGLIIVGTCVGSFDLIRCDFKSDRKKAKIEREGALRSFSTVDVLLIKREHTCTSTKVSHYFMSASFQFGGPQPRTLPIITFSSLSPHTRCVKLMSTRETYQSSQRKRHSLERDSTSASHKQRATL